MLSALALFLGATSSLGWSVSSPYSDADPLLVSPGAAGQFSLTVAQTPSESPSPVNGYLPPESAWFAFGGDGIGGPVTSLFLMPGASAEVEVHFAIPADAAPGIYDFIYEFTRLDDGTVIVGGFPVIVEGSVPNVPPVAALDSCGPYEIGVDVIALEGGVEDADGDPVDYTWLLDGVPVSSGIVETTPGGGFSPLPQVPLELGLGAYEVALVVTDGLSDPAEAACDLVVRDTTPPDLDPAAEPETFRPSKKWRPVVLLAQATDNSGGAVLLDASISISGFSAPAKGPRFAPDAYIDSIDQTTGTIHLMVKPYGSKKAGFPVFDVEITAADESGNTTSATVTISVVR